MEQTPDPGRFWVRFAPRPWPGAPGLWLDLFDRGLGRAGAAAAGQPLAWSRDRLNDVLYLPPVEAGRRAELERLVGRLAGAGTPLVVQQVAGDGRLESGPPPVWDLLSPLASGDLEPLARLPAGAAAVWPLIAGYTADPGLWQEGLGQLAAAGVATVVGIAAELSPLDRRRLMEAAGEQGFEALFHGEPPSEREFARRAWEWGLEPFAERPLPEGSEPQRGNRRLAALLARIGELWLRLGRSEARGQAFFRAARWVDREVHDLRSLSRDGNLGVVGWLDESSRQVIDEFVAAARSSLLEELRREYLEPG